MITQTMAEYLAHVIGHPFDGILFKSVQRAKGVNVVLFPEHRSLASSPADVFHVGFTEDSFKLMSTRAIRYKHESLDFGLDADDEAWVANGIDEWDED